MPANSRRRSSTSAGLGGVYRMLRTGRAGRARRSRRPPATSPSGVGSRMKWRRCSRPRAMAPRRTTGRFSADSPASVARRARGRSARRRRCTWPPAMRVNGTRKVDTNGIRKVDTFRARVPGWREGPRRGPGRERRRAPCESGPGGSSPPRDRLSISTFGSGSNPRGRRGHPRNPRRPRHSTPGSPCRLPLTRDAAPAALRRESPGDPRSGVRGRRRPPSRRRPASQSGNAARIAPTVSFRYSSKPPGLGPSRTTTASSDGITMVTCPMNPAAQ